MIYNFDEIIDRSENHSAKYDERMKKFGTNDVIPLWIADMDFRTAQPIIDALTKRAQEGLWGYTNRHDGYFAAIRAWQKRRNNWDFDQSLMSWSLGVVQSIYTMIQICTPVGGNVLIQTPVYSEFYDEVCNQIREKSPKTEIVHHRSEYDPEVGYIGFTVFDFQSIMNEVLCIIESEKRDCEDLPQIFVNISAGTSEYSAASLMASMMHYDIARPFTVSAKEYAERGINFITIRPPNYAKVEASYFIEWAKFLAEHKMYFIFLYAVQYPPKDMEAHFTFETVAKIKEIAGEYFLGDMLGETGSSYACKLPGYYGTGRQVIDGNIHHYPPLDID